MVVDPGLELAQFSLVRQKPELTVKKKKPEPTLENKPRTNLFFSFDIKVNIIDILLENQGILWRKIP